MSENKKIAKNTLILYVRLIIVTIIGLYVSRLVLLALGASDFGLYAIVGGIVSMMNFLNTTMIATSYRYITVELGKGDNGNPNKIYNTVLLIHIVLALILVILAESLGIWYIKHYLNVDPVKIPDALFVLHLSVLASFFSVISVPNQGLITAKENFMFISLIEILKVLFKLFFVYLLISYLGNKLRLYAVLMAVVLFIQPFAFFIYGKIKEKEIVKWKFNKNKADYLEVFGFAWWILFGAVACIGRIQGAAIVINWFFGTVLNAAFGIANQVNNYIMMFVGNLNQATVPQIMKSHSAGETSRSMMLVYKISKYAFFIMLIPTLPLLLSMDYVLVLWLKQVPEFTKEFTILMLICGLISSLGSGFDGLIQATGNIKKNQIWFSLIMLLTLPVSIVLFKLGFQPYIISVTLIIAQFLVLIMQLTILVNISDFKINQYVNQTIKPVFFVVVAIIPQYFINFLIEKNLYIFLLTSVSSVIWTCFVVFLIGLNKKEKNMIINYIKKKKI